MSKMSNEAEEMIRAEGLSKYYGSFAAIEDVTFSIPRGQVVAFLGPNGAGKTTTMQTLTGYMTPTRGRALIKGINVTEDRVGTAHRIGYLPETGPLYPDMTPTGLLRFYGEARGITGANLKSRIDAVVSQCALEEVLFKPISKISHGYRQRVGLAQSLLHEPEILILDEPTSGLDPNQIRQVREMISSLAATRTVLLSTHIIQEVEAMADRIILIHEGRIRFDGSIEAFLEKGEALGTKEKSIENVFCTLTSGKQKQEQK